MHRCTSFPRLLLNLPTFRPSQSIPDLASRCCARIGLPEHNPFQLRDKHFEIGLRHVLQYKRVLAPRFAKYLTEAMHWMIHKAPWLGYDQRLRAKTRGGPRKTLCARQPNRIGRITRSKSHEEPFRRLRATVFDRQPSTTQSCSSHTCVCHTCIS